MHTNKEQKIIQLFMAILFLAIVMVYILLFQVKGSTLRGASAITPGSGIQISVMSGDLEQTLTAGEEETTGQQRQPLQAFTGTITGTTSISTGINLPSTGVTVLTSANSQIGKSGAIQILSGTNVFYGTIEAIEKLGIKYKYALIDSKNIYYVNLGSPTYDFAAIARKLGGNLYELKTEAELVQNKLFGDKVVFINLPEYKEKRTIFLLYIDDEVRLLQMDYALYHKSKAYIKSLFIQ